MNRQILQQTARQIAQQKYPSLSKYEFKKYATNYTQNGLKNFTKDAKAYWNYFINSHKYSQLNCGYLINPFISFGPGWDFDDDFTGADNWTDVGINFGVDLVDERIEWSSDNSAQDHGTHIDPLGFDLSDTAWIMDVFQTFDTVTFVSNTNWLFVGLSDSVASARTNQDSITVAPVIFDANPETRIIDTDGATLPSAGDATFAAAVAVGIQNIRERRLTATTYDAELFSDAYITSIELENGICNSTTDALRNIRIMNDSAEVGTNTFSGHMDRVRLRDAVTTPP